MKNLVVNQKFNNKKLIAFLSSNFSDLSINTIYKALRKKDIIVNGKRICENIVLHSNDSITIYISDDLLYKKIDLGIVYEDDNILLINKPANLSITQNKSTKNNLDSIISSKYSSSNFIPKPCHRLDMNTIGLVLYAKNEESLNILFDKFKNKEIEKHYVCVVSGIPNKVTATLNAYLFKDSKNSIVYISDTSSTGYLPITTHYKIIKTNTKKNISLLDINLETGRTHQIRAHLAHIGYPIIGDGKYGINSINKSFNVKTQLLCSYKLKFNFTENNGILDYLNHKEFTIDYKYLENYIN